MLASLTDIFSGFIVGYVLLLGPPLAIALWAEQRHKAGWTIFPHLLLLAIASFFLISGFLARFLVPNVWTLVASVLFTSFLCVCAASIFLDRDADIQESLHVRKTLSIALLLSFFAIADCVWIYCLQSWGYDGRFVHVLSPMQLDPQRNTNLVAMILRGDIGVFLPNDPVLYQLLWYRGAATLMVALPTTLMPYFQVGGLTLLTGWLLYFLLLSMILRLVPREEPKIAMVFVLCAVLLLQGGIDDLEIFRNVVRSLLGENVAGSVGFQYFSLKHLVLTAPQHSLFFIFFLSSIYFREIFSDERILRVPVWWFLTLVAVVASPVLAAFSMPAYALADLLVHGRQDGRLGARRFLQLCTVALAAFLFHWLIIGFPPSDLFDRTAAVDVRTIWKDGLNGTIRFVVLAPFLISGVILGLCLIVFLPMYFRAFKKSSNDKLFVVIKAMVLTSLITFILWNFVITDTELRRHSSMVMVVLISLVVGLLASRLVSFLNKRSGITFVLGLAAVGAVLEYRFVDAFTTSRSTTLSVDVPWADYFTANRYISETLHARGVIAASGEGVVLPIANNIAPTLAPKLAIIAHQRVSGSANELLSAMRDMRGLHPSDLSRNWLEKAKAAGFDTMIWGPVEESQWGFFGRRLLLDTAILIASFGEVGIFQFSKATLGAGVTATDPRFEAKQIFLEMVACKAYVRQKLRENQGSEGCDASLKLPHAATMVDPNLIGSEIDLVSVGLARQSSIRSGMASHGPTHAIGLRSAKPDLSTEEMAITETEKNAWWEIDLGREYGLSAISIDRAIRHSVPYKEHLVVMVSEEPFPEKASQQPPKSSGAMLLVYSDWPDGQQFATPLAKGRYLRIQVNGNAMLALDRVRLWKRAGTE